MSTRKRTKYIHEGKYVAEVNVDLVEDKTGWSPYLTVEDACRLDDVRNALRRGDVPSASKLARVFRLKDQAKYLGLVAGLVVLVSGLSGCFTIMTGQAQYRADKAAEFKHFNVPILSDTIFAVGRLDAASAKVLEVPDAVAFLGTKNTYMVLEGGTALMQAATELDGKRITLTYRSRTLFLKDKTIWGFLTLYYGTEEKQTYSPDEIATLSKLGFVARSSGSFEKKIEVKGLLYPALALSEEQMQRFKVSRQIDLYNPPDSSPPPDFSRTLIVPLAVAADIVTLPIQFIGFTVFVLTLRGPA